MVKRGVINGTKPVASALVYKSSSRSAWAAHISYNVFKAKKNISINAIADKNRDTTKHSNKLEICYSSVITQEIYNRPQLTIHIAENQRLHQVRSNSMNDTCHSR